MKLGDLMYNKNTKILCTSCLFVLNSNLFVSSKHSPAFIIGCIIEKTNCAIKHTGNRDNCCLV